MIADGSHSLFLDSPEPLFVDSLEPLFVDSLEPLFVDSPEPFLDSPERGGNVRCAPRSTSERPALLNGVTAF